ncbi:MAG: transposase [Pseudomonadota bacterium]|nr:transposase [Pseudomonadota bacterium]
MARLPRLTVAGYPHHVIQRGNNRQPIFLHDDDRRRFLTLLHEYAHAHQVAVHAYVLMDNHIHLLLTPDTAEGLPRLMQAVGRHYVGWFNRRHGRSGTLWEGRYRSALIEAERYLLACMVYIDLNPVRAGMVAAAADFGWSSHAALLGQRQDPLLTPHPLYWALGNTPFARERAYAELVAAGLAARQQADIRKAVHSGWALGGEGFVQTLSTRTQRRVARQRPGRPERPAADAVPDAPSPANPQLS